MVRKLKRVIDNGKALWKITDGPETVKVNCLPCKKMQQAQKIAEKVTADIEAYKNNIKGDRL